VGSKIGAPFVASPDSSTDNRYCRPILLKSGNLLVVYSDNDKNDALYAQQLTTDGVAVGFKVSLGHNATTNYRVVALTTGGFLALYPRSYKTGGNWAQLFDENTIALDNKFPISDDTTLNAYHNNPNAALLAGGEVVVAFNANLLEGGDNSAGCFSRRMTQAGTFLSDDTQVNTTVTGSQQVPLPVALSDGRYAIYWQGWADEDTSGGIHLQRYAADHSKLGSETRVNTYTDSAQGLGAVAVLPDDSQIVVYSSNGQDGSSQGIFAQRFSKDGHKLYR
jgi:hypothetical protein